MTAFENVYHNVTGDTAPEGAVRTPGDAAFAAGVNRVLETTATLAREMIGAHQGAAALIVGSDWPGARKFFSLSAKYAAWADYRTPAVGVGMHSLVIKENEAMRFTQAQLEAHPSWMGFGTEAGKHPPMNGWLAVPLIGADGRNYGLLQLSDRYAGDFSAEDEAMLTQLSALASVALDSLCDVHQQTQSADGKAI